MKVASPFGEYPFVYQRVERKGRTLAVVGSVAGVESQVVLDGADLRAAAKLAAVPAATLVLALAVAHLRRAA